MSLSVDIRKTLGDFTLGVRFTAGDECLALLGASGSGKSLTLKCIAGILRPDEGHIELDGTVLFDSAARVDLPPQRRQVGYLFQQYALFPNMTVAQNVAAAARRRPDRAALTDELLERFRLSDVRDHRPAQLSGGQQQRTALARIFASSPRVILLDEPLSALDSYLRFQLELELQDALARFSGPSLWVTHDRGEAWRSCRRVCVLDGGRGDGAVTMASLFHDPGTESAARLSGCKNYVSARAEGCLVHLPDWGITLRCAAPVPPETRVVGIRSHCVRPAAAGAVNAVVCTAERVIDDVFGKIVLLRPEGALPGAPLLRMELSREAWAPLAGQARLVVAVEPADILPLR